MRLLLLLLTFSSFVIAQTPAVVQQDLMNFEPGELVVKLKDDVDAGVYYEANGKAMSNFNIGELLGIEEKVSSSKVMFHQSSIESSIQNQKRLAAQYAAQAAANPNNGYQPEPPRSMKNVFVITTTNEQENIPMLVEELKNNPNVDYAEPNYIYGIDDFEVGEIITAEQASKMTSSNSSSTIEVDDPLYSSQSNITATNIDDVWDQYTTGDGSQVIAILDTGVDYTHPDLEANIWINEAELNGVEGYDDDGNGYVDDIRGWDFFNNDNAPLDDNMHGTHVAGIAGAVGNNGIGIAGAAWNVKLMPIKVLQSSGSGNITNIADGIEYATNNGATVLNMSFSGSYSNTLESVLALAYENSDRVLVAAVGNNSKCTDGVFCEYFFPAGYPFVLGVAAPAYFSNYDNTGPYYSPSANYNYELIAPGVDIMSTIPNGAYSQLSGTSMAAPLVAGSAALYNEVKEISNNLILYGDFINSGVEQFDNTGALDEGDIFDLLQAIEIDAHSMVKIHQISQFDDNENNVYPNGTPNAGEIIDLYVSAKNFWSTSGNIMATIVVGGNQYQNEYWSSLVTIEDNSANLGTLSDYATGVNTTDPFSITLNEDITDGTEIEFIVSVWDEDYPELIDTRTHTITVTNMITLTENITSDLTLEEGAYLIDESIIFVDNAVLTIMPGTEIYIRGYYPSLRKINNGKIIANGTKDKNITFYNEGLNTPIALAIDECTFCNFYATEGISAQPADFHFFSEDFQTTPSTFTYCDFGMKGQWVRSDFYGAVIKYSNIRVFYPQGIGGHGMDQGEYNTNPYSGTSGRPLIDSNGQFYNSGPYFSLANSQYNNYVEGFDIYESYWGPDHIPGENGIPEFEHSIDNIRSNIITTIEREWVLPFGSTGTPNHIQGPKITSEEYANWSTKELRNLFHIIPHDVNYFNDMIIVDANDGSYLNQNNSPALISTDLLPDTPYSEAPGFVWKIEINNKILPVQLNTYQITGGYVMPEHPNNYLTDDLGVGTHEFKLYFNRSMDTSVNPTISYGVYDPFNQKTIQEEGTWSSDGTIYTVNHDINIGAMDGINRVIVSGVKDDNNFDLVPSNIFKFYLQSAGSASTGFFAAGGLGKIDLEWVAPSADELDDVLGYNMYRYQIDEDGNESEPEQLNETLIIEDTDESTTGVYFTDYDVVEGQTYFYKYKILRTSFEETDYSNTVSSAPLTSTLGDSNGDFDVNVLDLVHDVDYILGNNPEPFIFVAGDVNADNAINVLDIVGTVDIILNGDGGDVGGNSMDINFYPSEPIGYADFSWEGNDLYVESMHSIGGLQLAFDADFEYVLHDLPGVERLDYNQDESKVLMLYSFNNTAIASTRTKLLTRLDSTKEIDIDLAVAGTTTGAKLTPRFKGGELDGIDSPFQSNGLEFLKLFPNPSNGAVTLEYYLPKNMDGAVVKVYDMVGRLVWVQAIEREKGMQRTDLNLNSLQKGNYVVIISAGNNSGEQLINHKLLILK